MALSNLENPKELEVINADSLGNIFESVTNSKSVTLVSEFPTICKDEACLLGVDEAGRGPVLGPMVYGISYCPISKQDELKKLGCADSKSLTEEKRGVIFKELCDEKKSLIGWAVEVISPNVICNSMLSRQKKSLNQVSHDSAIGLIKRALDGGINVTHVYVDTVGPADKYQDKLSEIFPQLNITVASKADATYPIVSAASICAKVIRDFALQAWKFPEGIELPENKNWGSGYPNDPVTKKFMLDNIDPVFGYPQLVRFSWSTASKLLDENAVLVEWDDEEDESDVSTVSNNRSITSFFKTDSSSKQFCNSKRKKHQFFIDRKLTSTVSFDF